MVLSVTAAALITMAWPTQLEWLRPRKPAPSAEAQQRQADKVVTKVYDHKGWQMVIQKDGFTGQVRCRLYSFRTLRQGRISYAQSTLGFQLGPEVDAADAWYRIDNGPSRRWQELYPDLARNRVPLEGDDLEHPTGGVVLIPKAELIGARSVTIRADARGKPRRFKLGAFHDALAAARYNGCAEESFERGRW